MAPSGSLDKRERYGRMGIGAAFVAAGFLVHRDALAAVTLVTVGSAVTSAAALGY